MMNEDVVTKAKEGKWYSLPEAEGIVDGVKFNLDLWTTRSILHKYAVSACRDPDGDKHCETVYFNTYYSAKKYFDEMVSKYGLGELPRERHW